MRKSTKIKEWIYFIYTGVSQPVFKIALAIFKMPSWPLVLWVILKRMLFWGKIRTMLNRITGTFNVYLYRYIQIYLLKSILYLIKIEYNLIKTFLYIHLSQVCIYIVLPYELSNKWPIWPHCSGSNSSSVNLITSKTLMQVLKRKKGGWGG